VKALNFHEKRSIPAREASFDVSGDTLNRCIRRKRGRDSPHIRDFPLRAIVVPRLLPITHEFLFFHSDVKCESSIVPRIARLGDPLTSSASYINVKGKVNNIEEQS